MKTYKNISTQKKSKSLLEILKKERVSLFPSDEIIITFYSDRNLNERMEFKNSLIFSSLAKFGSSLKEELKRLKENFEVIVVDTSGRDTKDTRMVMILSDIIVIPAIPSQFDVVVLEHMLEIFNEVKEINESVKGFVLPNRVSPNPFLSKELLNLIQYIKELIKEKELEDFKLLKSIIYERQAYRKAILDGKTLDELCSKNDKALLDFDMFFKELQNEIRR